MRATLERTGGFAGMRLATTADTSQLSPEDAQRLKELVDSANFFQLPETITPKTVQPDRFQYRLTVEDDNHRTHTVTVGEAALPPNVRPLADFLTQIARRG
jgi:hypothetical protein